MRIGYKQISNNANVEKYRTPIPISRYFEIPIPNTEPTFKNAEKYRKTDIDFKYRRHRPKTNPDLVTRVALMGPKTNSRREPQ